MATQRVTAEGGKSPRDMTIGLADRIAARITNSGSGKMEMTAREQSIVSATANIPCGNPKSKPSAR